MEARPLSSSAAFLAGREQPSFVIFVCVKSENFELDADIG